MALNHRLNKAGTTSPPTPLPAVIFYPDTKTGPAVNGLVPLCFQKKSAGFTCSKPWSKSPVLHHSLIQTIDAQHSMLRPQSSAVFLALARRLLLFSLDGCLLPPFFPVSLFGFPGGNVVSDFMQCPGHCLVNPRLTAFVYIR